MIDETPADEDLSGAQTILEHLNELRIRLTWAAGGLIVGTIITVFFAEQLVNLITEPFCSLLSEGSCVAIRPTETLEIYFRTALVSGAIVSMPWLVYQLWLFIAPGLEPHERRYVYIFVPAATLLFLSGVLFAWFVLLPPAVAFLSSLLAETIEQNWTLDEVVDFVTTFIFWLGLSFQMPLIVYFLGRVGVVTPTALREQWRIAVVGIAVLAAIITPSVDPVTMLLTMAPLLFLYLVSIVLAGVGRRQFEQQPAVDRRTAIIIGVLLVIIIIGGLAWWFLLGQPPS